MKTTQQLESELQELLAEESALRYRHKQLRSELEKVEARINELSQSWGTKKGLIAFVGQQIEDSKFPIYDIKKAFFGEKTRRIVAIDAKSISLKDDGFGQKPVKYRRNDGFKFGSRGKGYDEKIDVTKAVEIWEQWEKKNEKTI